MPPTLTRSLPPQAATSPGRTAAGWAAAGIAALVGAIGAGEVLEPPGTVDIVVVNPSAVDVTVVIAPAGGGRLPVATVDPGEERSVAGVLDRGDLWVVSFLAGGEQLDAPLEITRSALAELDFRLTVPADAAADAPVEGGTSG